MSVMSSTVWKNVTKIFTFYNLNVKPVATL